MSVADQLVQSARDLRDALKPLCFAPPTAYAYCPLEYAWAPHEAYLRRFGDSRKKVVFMGMNPGPWGMTQTGVPFGEITAVRDWLGIHDLVGHPEHEHPKRRVLGFECKQSEVSGRRLWGLFEQRFKTPEAFFTDHFVANYCPLVFMEETGRNRTPDKLPREEAERVETLCDAHLYKVIEALQPKWVIGIGAFAEQRARRAVEALGGCSNVGRILHPSPASPAANRDWAGEATRELVRLGVWGG